MSAVLGPLAIAGCAPTPQPPSEGAPATYRYTCCQKTDVDQVLRPGDVLVVHWIVETLPPTQAYPQAPVTLSASLTGSYPDVTTLKSSVGVGVPSPRLTAAPVQTTNRAGGAPVSTIAIPTDAAPGLYDLSTSVESGGGRASGESVVRVEARTAS
ncbi:hypothetical protein [Cellulomonas sp. NTE-D12]|uniref:hypothetical protein n=1 Tax=Cellulomonas sp. NTE-D12 TaxID=2962632 RepID=UPI003081D30C|nr:hypothetical protein CELD12_29040 [Cellulomonas sp. NTE-D12]